MDLRVWTCLLSFLSLRYCRHYGRWDWSPLVGVVGVFWCSWFLVSLVGGLLVGVVPVVGVFTAFFLCSAAYDGGYFVGVALLVGGDSRRLVARSGGVFCHVVVGGICGGSICVLGVRRLGDVG